MRIADTPIAILDFAEVQEKPVSLGIVLQTSGMESSKRLHSSALALTASLLKQIPVGSEYFVIAATTPPQLWVELTQDPRDIESIASQIWGGFTGLYDSILVGIAKLNERPGSKVMLVLTGGFDIRSSARLHTVIQALGGSDIQFHIVYSQEPLRPDPTSSEAMLDRDRDATLLSLLRITVGSQYGVRIPEDAVNAFAKILSMTRYHYVLGVDTRSLKKQGKRTNIDVSVSVPGVSGLRVQSRQSWIEKN